MVNFFRRGHQKQQAGDMGTPIPQMGSYDSSPLPPSSLPPSSLDMQVEMAYDVGRRAFDIISDPAYTKQLGIHFIGPYSGSPNKMDVVFERRKEGVNDPQTLLSLLTPYFPNDACTHEELPMHSKKGEVVGTKHIIKIRTPNPNERMSIGFLYKSDIP